jgi:hypothetical protein
MDPLNLLTLADARPLLPMMSSGVLPLGLSLRRVVLRQAFLRMEAAESNQ